jgi:hypothetical protein
MAAASRDNIDIRTNKSRRLNVLDLWTFCDKPCCDDVLNIFSFQFRRHYPKLHSI